LQACEGLAAAHARGIVHRDLKPGNLFLTRLPDGREIVKLLDFGLAKSVTSDDGRITATGAILGSPSYMSPEQLAGQALDARSDVWSLGVTLYELLTRELPFPGATTPKICAAVLSSSPVPITSRRADVPEDLARVIEACLAKEPENRPRSVADLAARLEPFCETTGVAERVAKTLERGGAEPALGPYDPHESPTHLVSAVDAPPRSRSIATIAVVTAIVIGLGVTIVMFAFRGSSSPATRPSPRTTITSEPTISATEPATSLPIATVTISAPRATTTPRPKPHPTPPNPKSSASSNPLERF
jgi:serine/threonine-protein kinase